MKTTRTMLMLLIMGIVLCSTGQVFAEDVPEDGDVPEMHDGTNLTVSYHVQTSCLTEEPEPDGDEPVE